MQLYDAQRQIYCDANEDEASGPSNCMGSFQGLGPNLLVVETLHASLKDHRLDWTSFRPHKTWICLRTHTRDCQFIILHFDWQTFSSPEMAKLFNRNGKMKITHVERA